MIGGPGYAASATGTMLFGTLAWFLVPTYPATGIVLMIASTVALAGLALRWRRHLRLQRRLERTQ